MFLKTNFIYLFIYGNWKTLSVGNWKTLSVDRSIIGRIVNWEDVEIGRGLILNTMS